MSRNKDFTGVKSERIKQPDQTKIEKGILLLAIPVDTDMSEETDYKITKAEAWELIRIRHKKAQNSIDEYDWYHHCYAYILLKKDTITDAVFEDELCIKIIPLIEAGNFGVKPLWNSCSTWSVLSKFNFKKN